MTAASAMKIACVGGGPAGLYAALLLKKADPSREVVVFERNRADVTFGFGVVFSDPTLDRLAQKDGDMYRELLAHAQRWDPLEVRVGGKVIRCGGQGFSAISRQTLLGILQTRARDAGVELRFETELTDHAALEGFDLILAADGLGSSLRRRFRDHFRPSIATGKAKYIWFATTQRFESLTFIFEKSEHGPFAVHAYPFDETRSTFIVETDEDSWRRAGFDSDDEDLEARSEAYCRKLFAAHLDGHPLLVNNSRWLNFGTVRAEKWHHENVVLLGDSAHTAHFSVGSGTKMALEDALALRDAFDAHSDIRLACEAYERERRTEVDRLQASSVPSLAWWENFRFTMDMSPEQFVLHFLTRNHRVTRASLRRRDPAFIDAVEAQQHVTPSSLPLSLRGVTLPNRRALASGVSAAGAPGLVLARWGAEFPAERARIAREFPSAVIGATIDAREDVAAAAAAIAEAGARVIELEISGETDAQGHIATVRAAWPKDLPLLVRVKAEAVMTNAAAWAASMIQAGADGITVVSRDGSGDHYVEAVMVAEEIRNAAGATVLLGAPGLADEVVETLLLSGRADAYLAYM